jgi:hypothetical protein
MLNINKKAKSLLVMFLALALIFSLGAQTVLAASVEEQIKEHTSGSDTSAEYYAFTKMWSDYFLDFLPTSAEPEALQLLTNIPDYDGENGWKNTGHYPEAGAWSGYFIGGYPPLMRDQLFFFAEKLDLINPNLSQEEKAERISKFSLSQEGLNSIFGDSSLPVGGDKDPTRKGDCVTRADGIVALYRLAGIPACGVGMNLGGIPHTEAFCYLNGEWRHGEDITETFTEFFGRMNPNLVTKAPNPDSDGGSQHYYSLAENLYGEILDINETWVVPNAESFMFQLLRKPYAYPDQKLTRGEIAKLLCNYINIVPMRNEQIFSDAEVIHPYSRYIWAMSKLGIMNGNGDGTFRPDSELSMQEFAAMASNVIKWGKAEAIKKAESWKETNPYIDRGTPEEIAKIDADYKKRAEEGFIPPKNSSPKVFADNNQIANWAKTAVDELSSWKILEGDSNGNDSRLHPTETLSKTRFLVFMYKFNEKLKLSGLGNTPIPLF